MGAVPSWVRGVLPAINPLNPTDVERSPYAVALTDMVLHFNLTPERRAILMGFLDYRSALHQAGLTDGFQWLDGSFMEDVENLENRAPNDIDVVTFFRLPDAASQADILRANPKLFDLEHVKAKYRVDGYVVNLGMPSTRLVRQSAYWYSMWSHRRNDHWKGFLELPLAPDREDEAKANLAPGLTPGGVDEAE